MSTSYITPPCFSDPSLTIQVDCTDPSAQYDSNGTPVQATLAALAGSTALGINPNTGAALMSSPANNGPTSLSSFFASLGGLATNITQAVAPTPQRTVVTTPLGSFSSGGLTSALPLLLLVVVGFIVFGKLGKKA